MFVKTLLVVAVLGLVTGTATTQDPKKHPQEPDEMTSKPYVFVYGPESVIGAAVIPSGGTLRILGRGFCGKVPCAPITLRVNGRT